MAISASHSGREKSVLVYTDWEGYLKILDGLGEHRGTRVTFDQGRLEIMTTSLGHESRREMLGKLMAAYLEEARVTYNAGGQTTFLRQDLDRGFEPDACWWIEHWQSVQGVDHWDSTLHPAPDLAVEVDVSSSVIPRLPLYAAAGVPEVWRWYRGRVQILLMGGDGQYHPALVSPRLPRLTPRIASRFVAQARTQPTSEVLWDFRQWLRGELTRGV